MKWRTGLQRLRLALIHLPKVAAAVVVQTAHGSVVLARRGAEKRRLQGILHPDDAVRAMEAGAAGIVVSNHGGRQADYAPATLDVLPAIVRAVDRRVPVLMDGGVRRGTDIIKVRVLCFTRGVIS